MIREAIDAWNARGDETDSELRLQMARLEQQLQQILKILTKPPPRRPRAK
jgi:hypothetical protein